MSDDKTTEIPLQTPMEALVAGAMMEKLGPEARDKLVTDSLVYLMRKQRTGNYGSLEVSPLAELFNQALFSTAREIVNDKVKNDPEVKAQIEAMLKKTIAAVLESDMFANLVSTMLEKALTKATY